MDREFIDELIAKLGGPEVLRETTHEMPVERPDGTTVNVVKTSRIERTESGATTERNWRGTVKLDCGHYASTQNDISKVAVCLCGGLVCGVCLGTTNEGPSKEPPDQTQIRRCRVCHIAVCENCGTKTPEGFYCAEHISRYRAKKVFIAPFEILAFLLMRFRKQEPPDGNPQPKAK